MPIPPPVPLTVIKARSKCGMDVDEACDSIITEYQITYVSAAGIFRLTYYTDIVGLDIRPKLSGLPTHRLKGSKGQDFTWIDASRILTIHAMQQDGCETNIYSDHDTIASL